MRTRSSLVLIVGISLLALGIGNAAMGMSKLDEYTAKMETIVAASGENARLSAQGTTSILDPSTDAQLLYESAFMKYEYYQVVMRGGLLLLGLGSLLISGVILSKLLQRSVPPRGVFPLGQS